MSVLRRRLLFAPCLRSVDPRPAVGHDFITSASLTRDDMVPRPHGPGVNARACHGPVLIPGQCKFHLGGGRGAFAPLGELLLPLEF